MKLLTAFLFLAAGCEAREPLHVVYKGDEVGEQAIIRAAQDWNDACGETLVVFDGTGVPLTQSYVALPAPGGGLAYGLTTLHGKVPLSMEFQQTPFAEATIAHEFGHALGIRHENDDIPNDVMNEDVRMPMTGKITKADCDEVR